jgi:hypothetical protein
VATSFIFTRANIVLWDGGPPKGVPKRRRMRNDFQRGPEKPLYYVPRSAPGLGCVKTPKLNLRTEISSRLQSI